MSPILFYLIQVIAASGLFYGYYHLALRNKTFHRYNRFYLLMAFVISSLIPFLKIPVYFSQGETGSSVVLQTLQVISSPSFSDEIAATSPEIQNGQITTTWFTTEKVIYLFYFFILSFFLLRVFISLSKIRSLIKRNPAEQLDKVKFINTDEPGTPFSFFRWLFWNRKIELHSEKGEQIFRHELFHIQQKHSWDIIFIELVTTVFWINPFFHLIKKEVKAIHEFLADEFAIKENNNWQYAELLLMQAFNTSNRFVNPFFHNQIKRRIAMITTSQKPSYRYLRKMMMVPVAAIIVFLFAFSYKNRQKDSQEFERSINPITVVIDAGHGGTDKGAGTKDGKYNEAELSLLIAKKIEALGPEYNINVIMTRIDESFPNGATNKNDALRNRVELVNNLKPHAFIAIHMNSTSKNEEKIKTGFNGYITTQRNNQPDIQLASSVLGELKKIYTTREEIKQRGDASIYVIDEATAPSLLLECGFINNPKDLLFVTDEKNQEKIARAILKGLVAFANINPTSKREWEAQPFKIDMSSDTTKPLPDVKNSLRNALVVIDGVIQPERGFYSIDSNLILQSKIEELRLFTDKSALDKYGEKGKDGVLEIDTKENYKNPADTIPRVDTFYWIKDLAPPTKKSPTQAQLNEWKDAKVYGVWLDGRRISNIDLSTYKPLDFGFYNISKLAKNAINYGKHYYQVNLYTHSYYSKVFSPEKFNVSVLEKSIVDSIGKNEDPLIVVNEKPMPGLKMKELKKIIPEGSIISQTILNKESAVKKYGDNGKYGAVEIKSKNAPPIIQGDETIKPGGADGKPAQEDDNKVFVKVQIEPSFPGGEIEWKKFVERNLDVKTPAKKGAKPGTYSVIVQFVVGKDGSITDVKPLTKHGFGMEEEAMRIIKKGPYWIPGIQNGHKVKAYKKQPVTFVIEPQTLSSINNTGFPVNAYLISPEENPTIILADFKKVKQLKLKQTAPVQSYELISFRITIDKPDPDKFFKDFVIKGNNFPGELLKIINDLDAETYITIEDIDVKIDGRQRRLPPRIYRAVSITTTPG